MPIRHMARWRTTAVLFGLLAFVGSGAWADEAAEARLRRDITFLASDECEGRGVETKGINKAADYIAAEFAKAGLKPGGPNGSWFQPFTITGSGKLEGTPVFRLRGPLGQEIALKPNADFQVLGISGTGKVKAPLVFVGFGITADNLKFDDFKGADVAGKVVVLLRHTPRWDSPSSPFTGPNKDANAALVRKQALSELSKAAAVILVNDNSEVSKGDKLLAFNELATTGSSGSIPSFHVKRAVLDPIFQSSRGQTLKEAEEAINRDLKPGGGPLTGWTAELETRIQRKMITVKNVVGVVEGSGPLAQETVVVGAHYDHLGYGQRGSLAKGDQQKQIHHGADDNGSGTTTVIELARRFGKKDNRQGRRLVFMTFSAEEMGLLGSRHYCNKEPLFPLDKTAAMVNLDMVGRMIKDKDSGKDKLIVEGLGTSKDFGKLVDSLVGNPGFHLVKKAGGTGPSDHDSFYRKNIPVLFFWTGTHSDYHRPSDTSDKINVAGMSRIADLTEKVIGHLAETPERPKYIQVAGSPSPGGGKGPRLGIMPDYEEEKEGVLIGGVSDGGPAALAGLKAGDQIVEMAGKSIKNLNTYMVIMSQQQAGQPLEIGILRNGKRLNLKVTPQ